MSDRHKAPRVIDEKTPLGAPEYPDGAKSSRTGSSPLSHEFSDDYPAIVARPDDQTRVIEGACGVQWIVQNRVKGHRPWRSKYFCRTKAGLLLYAKPLTPELLSLPDYFPERTADVC
jgi:hypothetical protein